MSLMQLLTTIILWQANKLVAMPGPVNGISHDSTLILLLSSISQHICTVSRQHSHERAHTNVTCFT
jgi:hypothetical protein